MVAIRDTGMPPSDFVSSSKAIELCVGEIIPHVCGKANPKIFLGRALDCIEPPPPCPRSEKIYGRGYGRGWAGVRPRHKARHYATFQAFMGVGMGAGGRTGRGFFFLFFSARGGL